MRGIILPSFFFFFQFCCLSEHGNKPLLNQQAPLTFSTFEIYNFKDNLTLFNERNNTMEMFSVIFQLSDFNDD